MKKIGLMVKILVVGIVIFGIFVVLIILNKFVSENIRTYEDINQVISKNYKNKDIHVLNSEEYYFLIEESEDCNEESLVRFDNNKYISYDKLSEKLGLHSFYDTSEMDNQIDFTFWYFYCTKDKYIYIAKRHIVDPYVELFDDYSTWESIQAGNYYYYMAVRDKEIVLGDYKIYACTEDGKYKIGTVLTD